METATELNPTAETENIIYISHPVKGFVKEAVGIPEEEPVALMYHFASVEIGERIIKEGFVNVSGRGTLASALDLEPKDTGSVPGVMEDKFRRNGKNVMLITFCLPAKLLKPDVEGKYGFWFDNRLSENEHPGLREVYDGIVIKYDVNTGKPTKMAKDDPEKYPVYIPPKYILGVSQTTQ